MIYYRASFKFQRRTAEFKVLSNREALDSADKSRSEARIIPVISVALSLPSHGRNVLRLDAPPTPATLQLAGENMTAPSCLLASTDISDKGRLMNSIFNDIKS